MAADWLVPMTTNTRWQNIRTENARSYVATPRIVYMLFRYQALLECILANSAGPINSSNSGGGEGVDVPQAERKATYEKGSFAMFRYQLLLETIKRAYSVINEDQI